MKTITKLINEFISGIDIEDKENICIAVEFARDTSINSIMVYNKSISDMDCGLGYKDKNGIKCKLFEIIWQDDDFEFWFCDYVLEMKLNLDRLDLMEEIIWEMNRYNNEVLP